MAGSSSGPAVVADRLFVGSRDGRVRAANIRTGEWIWTFQTGVEHSKGTDSNLISKAELGGVFDNLLAGKAPKTGRIQATPVVRDGTVYIGSEDHTLYALDANTGIPEWTFLAGQPIKETVVVDQGRVYFSARNLIFCVDAKTGQELWSFETLEDLHPMAKRSTSRPIVVDGVVYVTVWPYYQMNAPHDSFLHAINALTGQEKWVFRAPGGFATAPLVSGELAFFSLVTENEPNGKNAKIIAVDVATGGSAWVFSAKRGYDSFLKLTVGSGLIYGASGKQLFGIDQQTGEKVWSVDGEFGGASNMHLKEHLYVTSTSRFGKYKLQAIALETGEEVWSGPKERNLWIRSVTDESVYLSHGTPGANLSAVDVQTGETSWTFETKSPGKTGAPISSEPVRVGDRLYFATSIYEVWGDAPIWGHLYSIDAASGRL